MSAATPTMMSTLLSLSESFGGRAICRLGLILVLSALSTIGVAATHADDSLTLSPTITAEPLSIPIDAQHLAWLKNKKNLIVGVSQENFEPYEIIQGKSLKGIVADYIHLISSTLHLQPQIRVYPNIQSALEALQNGEVDVLGRGLAGSALPELEVSVPYALNTPIIVGRGTELGFSKIKVQGEIALAGKFTLEDRVIEQYPNVSAVQYASVLEALHAVEYQRQRWFIGDPIATGYYLSQGELTHLHTYPLKNWKESGYGFLFRADQVKLRELFNEVMEHTAQLQKERIQDYWSANIDAERPSDSVFTEQEQAWLATNPEVRVAINGSLPPYSFYDETGEIRGVVIDMLAQISQRIGVNFTIVDSPSVSGLEENLRNSAADMAVTILPNPDRTKYLRFTEPYLFNSFALVTNKNSNIENLAHLQNKKVAIQRNNFVAERIVQADPSIQLVKKESQLDSLVAVANGEADAAITLLPTATYLIRQYFAEDLKVATSLPDYQANLPFSIRKEQTVLYGVMAKAIDQLGPNYINGLMNNWKAVTPAKASVWKEYVSSFRILSIGATFSSMLLVSLILYLFIKRKHMQQEAQRFEFRSTLLDSIPMAIAVRDLDGRFVFCNQVFYAQLRITPDDVIGKLTSEFILLDRRQAEEHQRLYFRILENGIADQRQLDAKVHGMHLTFRQWDRPYTDKNGNIAGLISGYADMTSNVLLLQQLRDAHDRAVQASDAKSRFLAVMSHEIRTPLNAIIGLLELTIQRMDRGDAWDRDDLEVAYGSSKSLIELIDDILDLAKIESGNVTLMAQRCNLSEITSSVSRIFSGVARQKGLYLRLEENLLPNLDISLDAGRLKQVLSNLISNAVKFTDAGGIVISVSNTRTSDGVHVHIELADTGIGITAEDQAQLFKPFTQAANIKHSRGGTGLGLVICRQLVEMMGGTLELNSAPGQGTRITIDLTAPELEPAPIALPTLPKVTQPMNRKLKVLLVDDHPANRLLLGQQLQFLGHSVQEAEDGLQALTLLKQETFDLIITDCSMPVMDGYELTREWRAYEAQANLVPSWIMGFTANAQAEERVRCIETGMDGCLFKPVSLAELEACLDNLEPRSSTEQKTYNVEKSEHAQLIDKESINGLTNGNEKLIAMLLTQLHTSNELDLQQLNIKIEEEQWKELSLLAHRLKGVAKLINSKPLIKATMAYEEEFNNATSELQMKCLAIEICKTLEKLQAALSEQLNITHHSTNN
ncbi:two-component system sensor histidine kinase EvgS [Pseudomonas sp. TE3786]